jgi:dTDP-4-dehydrorhamnose reductase
MPFNHVDEDKNYISKLLKYPKVWSAPNSLSNTDEFVQSCYNLYNTGAEYGTYNMTNPDAMTAKEVLELAAEYGIKKDVYEYFESQEEFDKVIKTPRSNCVLDTTKLEKTGCGMLPVRISLQKSFENWNKKDETPFW